MSFGVDGARNLFTLSKKDRGGQQQSETSESMILYCLKLVFFNQIFIFSPNDSPSKTMKNVFYFI